MVEQAVTLQDKYDLDRPLTLVSGVQAIVRLLLEQAKCDAVAGLNTAGFVSGYRGSPLGGLDSELIAASGVLQAAKVVFEPGLNEDLAATAILGAQQIAAFGATTVDGVYSLWYGKGPGVDRSGDALKHGNMAGASEHGGVLVVFGDDHPGKSSTVAHQSEHAISAHQIPVLYPASVAEIIGYGLFGWALSRYSGLWVGLKVVNETADTFATVNTACQPKTFQRPVDDAPPPEGVHFRGTFEPQRDAELVNRHKLPLAQAFARANGIDRIAVDSPDPILCVVTAGKAYADIVEALRILRGDERIDLKVRVYKVGMIWPLEPRGLTRAASGCAEILVVEEKRGILEDQIARTLFNQPDRARLVGKHDEAGAPLVSADAVLDPSRLAVLIGERLAALGHKTEWLEYRIAALNAGQARAATAAAETPIRTPYFCSGCPHNSSTKTPQGALALSGIGCHSMAMWMDRNTLPPVQMGGEGANWIGAANFVERDHVFQNLGDGTYSHSGWLAIRAAVNAGVNLTYKILFNDAVAMTGGQPVEGELTVETIARQVLAAGVERCVVVSDDAGQHARLRSLLGVEAFDRSVVDSVQQTLQQVKGVTVLVFDQTCAAELRRRRKRGEAPDPGQRVFINAAVCEGCGDCTTQSNCVSVTPKETELGRKREIDQSGCNKDFSCLNGFCPSFVSVEGGRPRRGSRRSLTEALGSEIPQPRRQEAQWPYSALITGIGGTGVITIGAILGMAARLQGLGGANHNMTGMAQKGGAVLSHLRIAASPAALADMTVKVGAGQADLLIGCDLVVAGGREALATLNRDRTVVVLNTHAQPTAAFQRDRDFRLRTDVLTGNIRRSLANVDQVFAFDAAEAAVALFGDSVATNMIMVGYAYQLGRIPVSAASIEQAIFLNRVAVEANTNAFRVGRLAAHDPDRTAALVAGQRPAPAPMVTTFADITAHRQALLTRYQNAAYAGRYRAFVEKVRAAEAGLAPAREALSVAVAGNLARLMAYKDEYEVARLYREPDFRQALAETFEGPLKLSYHLAPPILTRRDPTTGSPLKMRFGGWMGGVFALLARMKILRGTAFDIFGYTAERRGERRLIEDYQATIAAILPRLTPENHAVAVELASYPDAIRGFGHVKSQAMTMAAQRRDQLLRRFA